MDQRCLATDLDVRLGGGSVPSLFQKNDTLLEQKIALTTSKTRLVPMFHILAEKFSVETVRQKDSGVLLPPLFFSQGGCGRVSAIAGNWHRSTIGGPVPVGV